MENALQKASNEHRSLYYSAQLKLMDVSQTLRAMGNKLTENQIKTATSQIFSNCCMLERIFQEAKLTHVYQLIKTANQNYNSLIAILLEKNCQPSPLTSRPSSREAKERSAGVEEGLPTSTGLAREIKRNKLGGIHLFNENYSRYLEDYRILEEIKKEKAKRLHRKRMDILRESIFEELNHKAEVEETPAKNDEITNYILKTKDKNSIVNYVSYEPELQEILAFFQNSQTEANSFLAKKSKVSESEAVFSFADFQREIQLKNMIFKNEIVNKFKEFIEKYRRKQQEMEEYLAEKEEAFHILEQKYFSKVDQSTQTDLNVIEFLRSKEQKIKELELKCTTVENMKIELFTNNEKEGDLAHIIALRDNQIDKLNAKISDVQAALEYVKKLLREEKIKKSITNKQQFHSKSQKIITSEAVQKEKEKQKVIETQPKQGSEDQKQEILKFSLRKASYLANTWRKKPSMDFFYDEQREESELSKTEKKKFLKYNIDSKYLEIDRDLTYSKNLPLSRQFAIQTESDHQDTTPTISPQENLQLITYDSEKDQQKIVIKKGKKSTHRLSSKNFDIASLKNASDKQSMPSQQLKQQNSITSLTKIRVEQDLNFRQNKNKAQSKKKIFPKNNNKSKRLSFSSHSVQKSNQYQQKSVEKRNQNSPIQSEGKRLQKKESVYKIFEVKEQQGEQQKENNKKSLKIIKRQLENKHNTCKTAMIDQLNMELKKLCTQNKFFFFHLYNLTIFPSHRKSERQNQQKGFDQENLLVGDRFSNKVPASQKEGQSSETKLAKALNLFDNLINSQGKNLKQKQKMQNWKKKLDNHLKMQTMTQKEAAQIISIICQSPLRFQQPSNPFHPTQLISENQFRNQNAEKIFSKMINPIASLPANIRNSLQDSKDNSHRIFKKFDSNSHKNKLKTSNNEDNQDNQDHCKKYQKYGSLLQMQQNIQNLIRYQSFHIHFKQKFISVHKKCRQGSICSHINKYFEVIMKYYDEKNRNKKQSLLLPIQHIGNGSQYEQKIQKLKLKKSLYHKQQKNKRNVGIQYRKNHNSQQNILPNIRDSKLSTFQIRN